jgi:calcineurin-like phosphoesterase family protein
MTEQLIARHNYLVSPEDTVFHLGDMFWESCGTKAFDIVNRLNGNKYYISGNHERIFSKWPELRVFFHWTKQMAEVDIPGYPKIILCHYALRDWYRREKGSWHLYGHAHGTLREDDSLSFDVGVDSLHAYYAPISIEEVAARLHGKMAKKGLKLFNKSSAPMEEDDVANT